MPEAPRPIVLVVDDYSENREMYAEFLEYSGFTVLQAEDGEAALLAAREQKPDAILMDLALPRLDGWEATRRLKSDPETRDIPVIALTGHAVIAQARRAREAGCEQVLLKPAAPDVVLATLMRLIAGRRGAAE